MLPKRSLHFIEQQMNTQITLKQLETLYWIVVLGTFERAAARMCATQSAISKRVQELERGTGIEIFNRNQRGAKLTVQGEELFNVAKQMLIMHDQIQELCKEGRKRPKFLRIGITELTAVTWFPLLIAKIQKQYPSIRIEPKVGMSRELFNDIGEDSLDLIIIPKTFSLPEFTVVPLASVQNHWVAKNGFISINTPVRHRELARYPVLVQGNLSGSGMFLNKWLKNRDVVFPRVLICDSMTALLGLAVAGLGVTYLPEHYARKLANNGKLEIIATETPLPPVPYVIMHREDRLNPFLRKIIEIAETSCNFNMSFQDQDCGLV